MRLLTIILFLGSLNACGNAADSAYSVEAFEREKLRHTGRAE
jgi:hypothetical protein